MSDQSARNPSLENLEVLVGDWDMELSGASFLPTPDGNALGYVGFEWIEGGALLLMRQGEAPSPSPPLARWVIGRDEVLPRLHGLVRRCSRRVSDLRDELWRGTVEDVA